MVEKHELSYMEIGKITKSKIKILKNRNTVYENDIKDIIEVRTKTIPETLKKRK
jgi:hypothetical protein